MIRLSRIITTVALVLGSVLLLIMLFQLMSLDVERHEREWQEQGWRHGDMVSGEVNNAD